jgi:hypothetical protein
MSIDWVTIERFAADVGMTKKAVQHNVGSGGRWPQGLVWLKLEGRIYISRSGWDRWLEMARGSQKRVRTQSKPGSHTKASHADHGYKRSPQIPTFYKPHSLERIYSSLLKTVRLFIRRPFLMTHEPTPYSPQAWR